MLSPSLFIARVQAVQLVVEGVPLVIDPAVHGTVDEAGLAIAGTPVQIFGPVYAVVPSLVRTHLVVGTFLRARHLVD